MMLNLICVLTLYKSIYCKYPFELPRQVYKSILWVLIVEAIQMSTHNICFYKEVGNITGTAIWAQLFKINDVVS